MNRAAPRTKTRSSGTSPAAFVSQHQGAVWRYLRYLGCTADQADDLTQETFLSALRAGLRHRDDGATRSYLRRTARSRFLNALRAKRVRPHHATLDEADAVWDRWAFEDDGAELRAVVRHCVERLTARARQCVELFYGQGESRASIAELLGLAPEGVKSVLRRAREALRTCIEGEWSR